MDATRHTAGGAMSLLEKHVDEEEGPFSVDDCLEQAGGWAAFQWRLLLTLGACTAMAAAHMLQPIFLAPLIDWPLSAWQRGAVSSSFFVGYGVGVFAWGWLSDRRGRRRTIIWSFLVGNLAGIGSFLAPNYPLFIALRCLCGFGISGTKNALFLLGTEYSPPSGRAQLSAMLSGAWLVGLLFLVGVARLLRGASWRWLVLVHAPALLLQCLLTSAQELPESPRFLLVVGEVEKAKAALGRVYATNGRAAPEPLCLQQPPSTGTDRSALSQLFRPSTRHATIAIGVCQSVCTMTFYAITFSEQLNLAVGDLYLGALLGALVELPAYIVLAPLTNRLGRFWRRWRWRWARPSYLAGAALLRRLSYNGFLTLSAASLLTLHLCSVQSGVLALCAVLCGRFASVAAVSVGYIVAAEIFPTSCRNSGIGWATGCGRIGAIASPAVMIGASSPLLIIAALCLVAAAAAWVLPEFAGLAMADVPYVQPLKPCVDGRKRSPAITRSGWSQL